MRLPRSTPRDQGIDATGIDAFLDAAAAAEIELHSFALARHGHVVAEGWWDPYRADRVHLLYSLSKSLTATAVATLVADGAIGLDDPVLSHLPTDGLDVDRRWEPVQVRHCLAMTVGHTVDAWGAVVAGFLGGESADFLALTLRHGPDAKPGTVFCYNQVATYLLSRLVAHVAGDRVSEVLHRRIFDPLGIDELKWQRDPDGFELGFTGAHLRTGDLLSLVQLWLERGRANGTELIPRWWFDAATGGPFVPAPLGGNPDWSQGYGFSYWIARHGYRGDGAYGQFGLVLPDHDVAVAITSETADMQAVLDLAWQHLLPAFDRAGSAAADDALDVRLSALALAPLDGGPPLTGEFPIAPGERDPIFDLPASYSSIAVAPREGGHDVTLTVDGVETTIPVGDGTWADGALALGDVALPTAASGGWHDDRFVADIRAIETPHTLRVEADRATGTATARWRLPPLAGPDPRLLVPTA